MGENAYFFKKWIEIDSSYKEINGKLDKLHYFTNIFVKLREISWEISASLKNLLQLSCKAAPLFPRLQKSIDPSTPHFYPSTLLEFLLIKNAFQ